MTCMIVSNPTGSASISSKFVENGFLELFLPYNPVNDDPVIQAICPELKAAKTGIFIAGLGDRQHWLMNADSGLILQCTTLPYFCQRQSVH